MPPPAPLERDGLRPAGRSRPARRGSRGRRIGVVGAGCVPRRHLDRRLRRSRSRRSSAKRGWIGMTWPVADGGHGRSALERFVVFEQLIAGGAPIAAMWFADRQIGPSLLQFGSPEQRRRWLPGILDGSSMWCIGMSEPDNGSDVAGLRTRAVRDGDDWIVTGQKVWTSGAAVGDWIYLIARTDPDAPAHAGLSDLVVDLRAPGIEIRRIVDMTGNDHFCEVVFDEVRVPGANLVGERNGSFRQVMRQMEHERGGIDRLVSNRLLFESVRRSAWIDRSRPARAPGVGAARDRLPDRSDARAARSARTGPAVLLRRHEGVLHRVRTRRRRVLRARSRDRGRRCSTRAGISRVVSRAASATRRRTRSWAAPRRSCATSSANGCSDCRAERAASIGGPAGQAFAGSGVSPSGSEPECTMTRDFVVRVIVT